MEVNLKDIYVDQIAGDFFIPSYQRGYRWTKAEVVRLLEDVYGIILNKIENEKNNNNNKSTQYCLQPIVVKKTENGIDVIDGQQRLTTLYLIYKYIANNFGKLGESKFTIEYEFNTGKGVVLPGKFNKLFGIIIIDNGNVNEVKSCGSENKFLVTFGGYWRITAVILKLYFEHYFKLGLRSFHIRNWCC